jgi:hypothetical protein
MHFLTEAFTAERSLNLDKIRPLLYLGSDLYTTPARESLQFIKRGI